MKFTINIFIKYFKYRILFKTSFLYILFHLFLFSFKFTYLSAQDLIAHYDFNNRITDQSYYQNNGRLIGNLNFVADRFGRPCSALFFDGGTFLEVPSSVSLESPQTSLTIAVWFQLPQLNSSIQWLTVACKGNMPDESLFSPHYRLQIQQNQDKALSICNPFVESPSSTISMSTGFTKCDPGFMSYAFKPLQWTFFVLVYDGNNVKCYVQGNLVFQEPYSEFLFSNKDPLLIGVDIPGKTETFTGAIDDLKIYNKSLSENEVKLLFQNKNDGSSLNIEMELLPNITKYTTVSSCGVKVDFRPPQVFTECGDVVNVKQVSGPVSGSIFPIGRTKVEFEAMSVSKKAVRSAFFVDVQDVTPPVFNGKSDYLFEINSNDSAYRLSLDNPKALDPCGIFSLKQTRGPRSGSDIKPGKYDQTFEATDMSGNSAIFTRQIIIKRKPSLVSQPIPTPISVPISSIPSVNDKDTVNVGITHLPTPSRIELPDSLIVLKKQKDFSKRKIEISKEIEVDSDSIIVYVFDNGIVDDDTVSLYYNTKLLLSNTRISDTAYILKLCVDADNDNILSLFAENLGSIPPNTAFLVIEDGIIRQELELSSNDQKNGSLLIRRRK